MGTPDLILGGSGFLGRELSRHLDPSRTIATHHASKSANSIRFNALEDDLNPLLEELSAGAAVYFLFGVTEIDGCARDVCASQTLNVDITVKLMTQAIEAGLKPVFISSDSVFDGEQGNYREGDEPRPIHLYGRQKREVEKFLEDCGQPYLIFRLPKVVSAVPERGTLFEQWIEALRSRKHIRCAHDQYFSPILSTDVARIITTMVADQQSGLFHLGGPERWSRVELFELLIAALQRFALPCPSMSKCSIREFAEFLEPRPLDCSLNCDKLRETFASDLELTGMRSVCQHIASNLSDIGYFAHSK